MEMKINFSEIPPSKHSKTIPPEETAVDFARDSVKSKFCTNNASYNFLPEAVITAACDEPFFALFFHSFSLLVITNYVVLVIGSVAVCSLWGD